MAHPFSTYAKFSEKLFLTPGTHTYVLGKGILKILVLSNFRRFQVFVLMVE